MENLSLVAAIGKNRELGLDNHLIWKIKEDLLFYKQITMHQNIIMGRKTLESMPASALKGRNVFVLSKHPLEQHYDINSFTRLESLLQYIEITNQNFIVVGGAQIYKIFLEHVDTIYLTEIDDTALADTFFPRINKKEWDIETIYRHNNKITENDVRYIRNRYVRRRIK